MQCLPLHLLTDIKELPWCILCGIYLQETLEDDMKDDKNTDPQASIFPFCSIVYVLHVILGCEFRLTVPKLLAAYVLKTRLEKTWWLYNSNQSVLVYVVRLILLEGDSGHDRRGVREFY